MTVRLDDLSGAVLLGLGIVAGAQAVRAKRRGARLSASTPTADGGTSGRRRSRWTRRRRRRSRATLERSLPLLAEAMARELRVGTALAAALFEAADAAGPEIAADLDQVRRATAAGAQLVPSLDSWSSQWDSAALDHLVGVIALGNRLGGELAPALDAVADSLRDRLEVRDEITSLTSQSRASAWLLTGLPPVAVAGLALVDTTSVRFLVSSPLGLVCLTSSLVLLGAGWWWMRWLTDGARA